MENIRQKAVIVVFMGIIFGLSILNLFTEDLDISKAERRRLKQLPEFSSESVLEGKYFRDFEEYLLDQFVFRNTFRNLNSRFLLDVLKFRDKDGIYIEDNMLTKLETGLDEDQINFATKKINAIVGAHTEIKKAYYSIIPDKNYYFLKGKDYPKLNYEKLFDLVKEGLKDLEYIDIRDDLSLDDYYLTDSHWKQESLFKVMKRFSEKMGFKYHNRDNYTERSFDNFLGVYSGWIGMKIPAEKLTYLTNDEIENAEVYDEEKKDKIKVYNEDDFNNVDPYDIYLSGATPIIKIKNDRAENRKLIIFRDSFGSSIAPLFINSFSDITLVDIRYISSKHLDKYIDFKGAEVLFLYNTLVYNSGGILK